MRAGGAATGDRAARGTEQTLADRVYDCPTCGLVIDRDVNAAVNLARYTPPPPKASPLPAAA